MDELESVRRVSARLLAQRRTNWAVYLDRDTRCMRERGRGRRVEHREAEIDLRDNRRKKERTREVPSLFRERRRAQSPQCVSSFSAE